MRIKTLALLTFLALASTACASTLDRESLRKLDHTGQDMANEYLEAIKEGTLKDPDETRKAKAEAFRAALRQQAINAGNSDLAPIE